MADMRISRLRLQEGAVMPTGYGMSYVDYVHDESVCHPIPLHLLVRMGRWLQMVLIYRCNRRAWDAKLEEAREAGYQAGFEEGYSRRRAGIVEEAKLEARRQMYEMIRRAKDNQPWWIDVDGRCGAQIERQVDSDSKDPVLPRQDQGGETRGTPS